MKRSLPSLITGILLAGVLLLYMVTFQVRFTEVAVIRTFGKARPPVDENNRGDVIEKAGLYWKWPWPIQQVKTFDNRIHVTTTTGEEMPTKDGKNVILTTAVGWRIDDPYTFSITCADEADAEGKLKTLVRDQQKTALSKYEFERLVSTERDQLKYDQIVKDISASLQGQADKLYGMRIESVNIESLALPQKITEDVFAAMRKERESVAARYTSEGESIARQMRDNAEGIAGTIMSFANLKAAEITAEGQRRAAEDNKIFAQDQDLASFLIQVEALPQILKDRTTILLNAKSAGLGPLVSFGPRQEAAASTTQPAETGSADQAAMSPAPLPEIIEVK